MQLLTISFLIFFGLSACDSLGTVQRAKDNLKAFLQSMLEKIDHVEPEETSNCLQPANCAELLFQGKTTSGVYTIFPRPWYNNAAPFKVYCDMETDGGGWTVFQKRDDYEVHENFYRGWDEYKKGFGNVNEEYWIGNDRLNILTHQDLVTMRVDLEDFEGHKRHAHYQKFQVANKKDDYRLLIGGYTGDVGDNMSYLNNLTFVTYDQNDVRNCSVMYKGGWWYENCHRANLNGMYMKGHHDQYAIGINWMSWKGFHYSLKKTEMKIRPVNFQECN